jgi:hypothetical protein
MSNAYTDLTSPFSKIEALFENQEGPIRQYGFS